jgi:branched-subunit amino acid aminotransferase/4-amino-4-deoxychorismate lyase
MIIGTTTEITPVVKINNTTIKDGTPGEITKKLQKEFYSIIL